jgi:drug/metabolite transporter (DMT)-like permease
MSGTGLLFTVISGASNGLLLCSWILAASAAPMITVEVFCMIGGVVIPLLISPIILEGESVTLIQWIGSLLLFAAVFCFSKKNHGKGVTAKVILLITVAFVMTYASQFLSTVAAGSISASVLYPLAYVISMPLTFIVDVLVFRERVTVANILGLLFVTASGILNRRRILSTR